MPDQPGDDTTAFGRWGDFFLLPFGDDPPALETRPPPLTELPDLHASYPLPPEWGRLYRSVEEARRDLPPGTIVPVLPQTSSDYGLTAVLAIVNPRTAEVVEVTAWYVDRRDPSPDPQPPGGDPDLWIHWNRRTALPLVQPVPAIEPPAPAGALKITVAGRRGIYLPCIQPPELCRGRRLRNAVQWTTTDGTFWSVQGFEPPPVLITFAAAVSEAASHSASAVPQ